MWKTDVGYDVVADPGQSDTRFSTAHLSTTLQLSCKSLRCNFFAKVSECLGLEPVRRAAQEMETENRCMIFLEDALFEAPLISNIEADPRPTCDESGRAEIPWTTQQHADVWRFVPFSHLRDPPQGLPAAQRFLSWIQHAGHKIPPCPDATLLVTSDGSYVPESGKAGWGIVFSVGGKGKDGKHAGIFVGCDFADVALLAELLGVRWESLDPYLAEVVGLFWAAISIIQLRFHGRAIFRCDCVPALHGLAGFHSMKEHPFCVCARAVHMSLSCLLRDKPAYVHIKGHEGDALNKLADALAGFGGASGGRCSVFLLDRTCWPSQADKLFCWLPHVAMTVAWPESLPRLDDGKLQRSMDVHPTATSADDLLRPALGMKCRAVADAAVQEARVTVFSFSCLSALDPASKAGRTHDGL